MPFPDIASAVEDAYAAEREMGFMSLYGLRSPVAFFAAQKIVQDGLPMELDGCPPWLVAELYEWIDAYRTEGKLVFLSSVGSADHTLIAARLAEILPPRESLDWPAILNPRELRYPSGRVHQYFTQYESRVGGVSVLHGLHREYTQTGQLTETEYRHGAAVGRPRQFDERGAEIAAPDQTSRSGAA